MIKHLKAVFPDIQIGYSDHTAPDKGMAVLSAAYLLGAEVIKVIDIVIATIVIGK